MIEQKHKLNGNSPVVFGEVEDFEPDQVETATIIEESEIIRLTERDFAVKYYLFRVTDDGIIFTGRLYLPAILSSLKELGYYKRLGDNKLFYLIKEKYNIIRVIDHSQAKDEFYTAYLKRLSYHLMFYYGTTPVIATKEAQKQAYLKNSQQAFNSRFLEHLDTHDKPILKDTHTSSHFFFKNIIAIAERDGVRFIEYSDLRDYCVWEDHLIPRNLNYIEEHDDCHYARFIRNVAGTEAKIKAFRSGTGYLINNFISSSKSQAVICYDEEPSAIGQPNGGTGKGVFCMAVKQLRTTFKLDGKNIRRDDKFKFQGITERTQVFWIDDAAENFPFEMLHSCITNGFTVEKKYQHQFYIPAEKSPKVVLCSNVILSDGGKTNIRRQFILEFSDHYSKQIVNGTEEPILEEHGCIFFDDDYWDSSEWDRFFSYMITCAHYYHQQDLLPYTRVGQERSRLRQTTSDSFVDWVDENLSAPTGEYDAKILYEEFLVFCGDETHHVGAREFNRWLQIFAEFTGKSLNSRKSNGKKLVRFD